MILRRQNDKPVQTFRTLRKKQQNSIVMGLLSRVDNQILKYNVKKMFQIWALYHNEDVNCQIISQMMLKKNVESDINVIRAELRAKNQKVRKHTATQNLIRSTNSTYEQTRGNVRNSQNPFVGASMFSADYCFKNSYATLNYAAESGEVGNWRSRENAERESDTVGSRGVDGHSEDGDGGDDCGGQFGDTAEPPAKKCRTRRVQTERLRLPSAAENQLFRAIDNRGLLQCSKYFDVTVYRVHDLPLIMCYTDHHIEQLINICRTSRTFPIHLLPRYLRADIELLLKS